MNITGALQERVACYGSPNVEDSELYSDLFIALTVLEKLEVSYSKSLITMTEYESELNTAVHQCNKCHTLVKSEFPTFSAFVDAFKDSETTFRRALVQLEGNNLIAKPMPSFPLSDQTTAAHLIVIFERCGEIKDVIETYENDSYMIQVGRIRDLIISLVSDLDRLDGGTSKLPTVDLIRDWGDRIDAMESRDTIDSQKLKTHVYQLKQSLLRIAHSYRI